MCEDCGCSISATDSISIDVMHRLNAANDKTAAHNRAHLKKHRVLCLNLMSSPGAGKTRLLESLIGKLSDALKIAVIEGDLETENDSERLRKAGINALQINTGTACHLDAEQIHQALHKLPLAELDVLFIENVGNLVCPASFDLGQNKNIVLLATTEGDDKPSKYPVMFRKADLVVISKCDLLTVLDDFSERTARENIRQLATQVPCLNVSAKNNSGLGELEKLIIEWQRTVSQNETSEV